MHPIGWWFVTGTPPFYNGAGGLTTHKGRPRKRCKIALPECSPPSDGDPFAAPNFGKCPSWEISCFIQVPRIQVSVNESTIDRDREASCGSGRSCDADVYDANYSLQGAPQMHISICLTLNWYSFVKSQPNFIIFARLTRE